MVGFPGQSAAFLWINAMTGVAPVRDKTRSRVLQRQMQAGGEPGEQEKRCEEFAAGIHAPEISAANFRRVKAFVRPGTGADPLPENPPRLPGQVLLHHRLVPGGPCSEPTLEMVNFSESQLLENLKGPRAAPSRGAMHEISLVFV